MTDTTPPAAFGSDEWDRAHAKAARTDFKPDERKRFRELLVAAGIDDVEDLPGSAQRSLAWLATWAQPTDGIVDLLAMVRLVEVRRLRDVYTAAGVQLTCRCGQTDRHRVTEDCGTVASITGTATPIEPPERRPPPLVVDDDATQAFHDAAFRAFGVGPDERRPAS